MDGMRIDRRLTFIGVMLIVLSMTMATQYATTKVNYTFGIVHPSNADIRFVGSDNSSADGKRVLRVLDNSTTTQYVTISLGDWMPNSVKNYTAAFAIVNEEGFAVNITHVNVSGSLSTASYIDIWLHGNRTVQAAAETGAYSAQNRVQVVAGGVSRHLASNCAWKLAAGDGVVGYMNGTGEFGIQTRWEAKAVGGGEDVRYNQTTNIDARNGTRDWVWVQISINIPSGATAETTATGQIWFHFTANTH